MSTCEFNQGSKVNIITGVTEHNVLCGKPACECRCKGELTSLVMPLCEYHRNWCASKYKWIITTIQRTETGSEATSRR
jgi:hypothetical protein